MPDMTMQAEQIAAASDIFTRGTVACADAISRLSKDSGDIDEIRHSLRSVLALMGDCLFRATLPFNRAEWTSGAFDMYFWPGYVSVLSGVQRLLLPSGIPSIDGGCAHGGFGARSLLRFPASDAPTTQVQYDGSSYIYGSYSDIPSVTWYDRVLAPQRVFHWQGHAFTPGGTHNWISPPASARPSFDLAPVLRVLTHEGVPHLSDIGTPLRVLAVHSSADAPHATANLSNDGTLTVTLPVQRDASTATPQLGQSLAHSLKANEKLQSSQPWPMPHSPDSFDDPATQVRLQHFRELLYDLWLAACLAPDWMSKSATYVSQTRSSLASLDISAPSAFFVEPPERPLHYPSHRTWYTLGLSPWITLSEGHGQERELGSAMFLCTHPLDPSFLALARSWIEHVYVMMRAFESSHHLQDRVRQRAAEQMFATIDHELGQVTDILTDDYVKPFGDYSSQLNAQSDLDRPALGEKAKAIPSGRLFDAAREYLWLWAPPKAGQSVLPIVTGLTLPAFFDAIFAFAVRVGIAARAHHLDTRDPLRIDKLADLHTRQFRCVQRFPTNLTLRSDIDNADLLSRAFALVFVNAIKHADWPPTGSNTYPIIVAITFSKISPTEVLVANPIHVDAAPWVPTDLKSNEHRTLASLRFIMRRLSPTVQVRMGTLPSWPIPENEPSVSDRAWFKTVISFTDWSPFHLAN